MKIYSMDIGERDSESSSIGRFYRNPSGGGGGGSQNANITTTTTNPVVPDRMAALDNALTSISTALTGAPVNLGPIPGIDAPKAGPLIPQPSMGNMFASSPFNMGFNGLNVSGQGSRNSNIPRRSVSQPRSIGDLFSGGMFKPNNAQLKGKHSMP